MRVVFEVTPLGINVLLEPFLPQSTRKTQQHGIDRNTSF